jgi:hypothetical protein
MIFSLIYRFSFLTVFFWASFAFGEELSCKEIKQGVGFELFQCETLSVLRLHGNSVQRARTHGELVRNGIIDHRVLDFFSDALLIPVKTWPQMFRSKAQWLLKRWSHQKFHLSTPPQLAEEVKAYAEGAGIEGRLFEQAVMTPDVATAFESRLKFNLKWLLKQSMPTFGCTSASFVGKDGSFVIGRNLDFLGANIWDQTQAIIIHIPEPGSSEIPHASIGAQGVHFGGITGINQEGLFFAVHQNFSDDSALTGVPMFLIGDLVLRSARTIEEAIQIIDKNRPGPAWTFLVGDIKSQNIVAIEVSKNRLKVRGMENGTFAQTNHFFDSEFKKVETLSPGARANSLFRLNHAVAELNRLQSTESPANLHAIVPILSYQENKEGYLSAHGNILKPSTIQTVYFESFIDKNEQQMTESVPAAHLSVSIDAAPTASGRLARFNSMNLFESKIIPRYEVLAGPIDTKSDVRKRQESTALAFAATMNDLDVEKAAQLMSFDTTSLGLLYQAVVDYQASRYDAAITKIEKAKSQPEFASLPADVKMSFDDIKAISFQLKGDIYRARIEAARALQRYDGVGKDFTALARKIRDQVKLKPWEKNLFYDFSSGYVRPVLMF